MTREKVGSDFISCPHCENEKVYKTSPICPKCRKRISSNNKSAVLIVFAAVIGVVMVMGILAAIAMSAYHEYIDMAKEYPLEPISN